MKNIIILNLIATALIISSCSKVESNETTFNKKSEQDILSAFETKTEGNLLFSALTLPGQSPIYYGFIGTVRENHENIDAGKFSIGNYSFSPQTYNGVNNIYTSGPLSTTAMSDLYNSQGLNLSLQKDNQVVFNTQIGNIPSPIKISSISSEERPVILKTDGGTITWETGSTNGLPIAIMLQSHNNGQPQKDYFLTNDDGSISASEIISKFAWAKLNKVDVTMYRGNFAIITGNDGKKYKIIVYSYTFFPIQIKD